MTDDLPQDPDRRRLIGGIAGGVAAAGLAAGVQAQQSPADLLRTPAFAIQEV